MNKIDRFDVVYIMLVSKITKLATETEFTLETYHQHSQYQHIFWLPRFPYIQTKRWAGTPGCLKKQKSPANNGPKWRFGKESKSENGHLNTSTSSSLDGCLNR